MKQTFNFGLITVVFLILGITAFFSCTKENRLVQPQNEVSFKLAAEEHNKGLDHVYGKLKEAKIRRQLNFKLLDNILPFTEASTYAFLKKSIAASGDYSMCEQYAERSFKQVENKLRGEDANENNLWDATVDESLTPKQKELLLIHKYRI